jgi:3'-5' exonuclease
MFLNPTILKKCLFIDIETVPATQQFDEMTMEMQDLWIKKSKSLNRDTAENQLSTPEESFQNRAGIYAEFAKIVCISAGYLIFKDGVAEKARIKSFAGDDEKQLIQEFADLLIEHYNNPERDFICGHNIKEFDIPFLCRRMVIHGIRFPALLDISGKKPWQTVHLLDTMDMWRFGDYKNYTSLLLLSATLGIPSPKDDMDGSMVGKAYWHESGLKKIITYCEKDVMTVMQIMLKYAGCPKIPD